MNIMPSHSVVMANALALPLDVFLPFKPEGVIVMSLHIIHLFFVIQQGQQPGQKNPNDQQQQQNPNQQQPGQGQQQKPQQQEQQQPDQKKKDQQQQQQQ